MERAAGLWVSFCHSLVGALRYDYPFLYYKYIDHLLCSGNIFNSTRRFSFTIYLLSTDALLTLFAKYMRRVCVLIVHAEKKGSYG